MKQYYYEVNGYIKGVTTAKTRWEAKRYCKGLTKRFCPNMGIRSIRVLRIKTKEPLYTEA